jgi:uncharacterized membrane protein (UPF0127 family)
MEFYFKNKKIILDVEESSLFGMFRGLMFRRREEAPVLLFDFANKCRRAIHSMWVFFPFVAVWLDDKNKVVEVRKVYPWSLHVNPKNKFFQLVEIPYNQKNKRLCDFLVDEEKI